MNGYLQRQNAQTQAYIQATCDIYSQWVHDHACLVLHEEFGFGPDRLKRFREALGNSLIEYDLALSASKDPVEAGKIDELRGKLDNAMRQLVPDGEPFLPFEERFPAVKKLGYGRKKK